MAKRKRYPKRAAKAQAAKIKAGDSVVVKAGVEDPDFGGDIGGWQGRVVDDWAAFKAWSEYLETRLAFSFEAQVTEWQERGPLQAGDQVKVLGIRDVEDLYGVLVDIRVGRRKYVFPLCDLKAMDASSLNYQLTDDYAVWFANR